MSVAKEIGALISDGQLREASKIWYRLPEEKRQEIWVAPTKGGDFTTEQREIIKSTRFRESYMPPSVVMDRLQRLNIKLQKAYHSQIVYWVPYGDVVTTREAMSLIEDYVRELEEF